MNDELKTIKTITSKLDPLDAVQRTRILDYVQRYYAELEAEADAPISFQVKDAPPVIDRCADG